METIPLLKGYCIHCRWQCGIESIKHLNVSFLYIYIGFEPETVPPSKALSRFNVRALIWSSFIFMLFLNNWHRSLWVLILSYILILICLYTRLLTLEIMSYDPCFLKSYKLRFSLLLSFARDNDLPLIVAIDLQPMAPIEGVIQVQGDITNARTAEVVWDFPLLSFTNVFVWV